MPSKIFKLLGERQCLLPQTQKGTQVFVESTTSLKKKLPLREDQYNLEPKILNQYQAESLFLPLLREKKKISVPNQLQIQDRVVVLHRGGGTEIPKGSPRYSLPAKYYIRDIFYSSLARSVKAQQSMTGDQWSSFPSLLLLLQSYRKADCEAISVRRISDMIHSSLKQKAKTAHQESNSKLFLLCW